jgi:putative ABC transport system substrate-binding protein
VAGAARAHGLSRRRFVRGSGVAGLGLLAGCGRLPGQVPARTPRVGILTTASLEEGRRKPQFEAFKDALRALGYVEGQNVILEPRWANDQPERLPELAAELVRLPVDVLVTADLAVSAATQATKTLPIVFASHAAPVEVGHVASYAHPGGNVTGLADSGPELSGKRVELLREMVPDLTRVAVMGPLHNPITNVLFKQTEVAARALGLEVLPLDVRTAEDIEDAFAALQRRADGLVVLRAPVTNPNSARIVALAAAHRLPAIYGDQLYMDVGGLAAYAANHVDLWRRAAAHVDKILQGSKKPADIPVELPMRLDFIVNLKTASDLGITLPPEIRLQITEVIQ